MVAMGGQFQSVCGLGQKVAPNSAAPAAWVRRMLLPDKENSTMRAPWVASTRKMYEPQENVQICVPSHTGMTPFGETSYVTLLSTSPDSGFVSAPLASAGEGAAAAQAQSEPTKATKTTRFTRQPYHHGSSSRRIPVRRRRGHPVERGPVAGTHA